MNSAIIKSHLEVATNAAVLLLCLALLSALSWGYFSKGRAPTVRGGLQKGVSLTGLRGLDYGISTQTLLVAMSTKCQYCTDSVPFYNRLVEAGRQNPTPTRILAVFPDAADEVERYVKRNDLRVEALAAADFKAMNIAGTPTVILVDDSGRVLNFWVGKVPEEVEPQIAKAIAARKT